MMKTNNDEFKYEVGLSFLHRDEAFAQRLADRLAKETKVYIYTEHQKEQAFKNAPELYFDLFSNDMRVVIIIYRDSWGKTPITTFEKEAIQRNILGNDNRGKDFIFLVKMDGTEPNWYTSTIYLDGNKDIESIASTILFHLKNKGGEIISFTPSQKLANMEMKRIQRAAREKRMDSSASDARQFIYDVAFPEFNRLGDMFNKLIMENHNPIPTWLTEKRAAEIQFSQGPYFCFANNKQQQMFFKWQGVYDDSLFNNVLYSYYGGNFRSGQSVKSAAKKSYKFTVDDNLNPGWADINDPDSFYTSEQILQELHSNFVDFIIEMDEIEYKKNATKTNY